jgi:nucleoside-diphosphate-sugar epimerase
MAGELVFITGGTGHVGYRVIVEALRAGYTVRAAVRSLSKGQKILEAPSVKELNTNNAVTLTVVPDMLAPGAYDDAIKGATYAIHIASPLSVEYKEGDDMKQTLIEPAVTGTINMLEAAKKAGTVKRIAITSSVIAILPLREKKPEDVYDEKNRTAFVEPPYENALEGYGAGKILALNKAEAWVEREKPSFDLVHLFPSFVEGRDELATTREAAFHGTNALILGPIFGKEVGSYPSASVHVDDVAVAHVKALDASVAGNQGYVLSTPTRWEDVFDIVKRDYPALPGNGKIETFELNFDAKKSEKVFGFQFKSFEEQVKSVVNHFLTLQG